MRRLVVDGQYGDCRVLDQGLAYNAPDGFRTHLGLLPPTGTDYLMFVRVPRVGLFKAAGKQHTGSDALEWDGVQWQNRGPAFGNRPVLYRGSELVIVRGAGEWTGAIGLRYEDDNGNLIASKDTYADAARQVYEYTTLGALTIGQSGVGGCVAIDGGHRYLLEPGDTQMVNVDRIGDDYAVAITKFPEGKVVFLWFNRAELPIAFPEQPLTAPQPDPPPPPPPTMRLPDAVFATLRAERDKLPSPLPEEARGPLLNKVAFIHKAEGWGVNRKEGGHKCDCLAGSIACDILHKQPENLLFDVIAGDENGTVVQGEGFPPPSSDRVWVAPVDPGGDTPPPDGDLSQLTMRVGVLESKLNQLVTLIGDLNTSQQHALQILADRVSALEHKPSTDLPPDIVRESTHSVRSPVKFSAVLTGTLVRK